MIGCKGLRNIQLICLLFIIDKDKEGGNGVPGPLSPKRHRKSRHYRVSTNIITITDSATDIMNL